MSCSWYCVSACAALMARVQALRQQLSVLAAAVPSQPPAFAPKTEPSFCSENDVLRQRYALLQAEDASIAAATACVHTWTVEQQEQLKAINPELPLAGVSAAALLCC